ncbi:SAF domain-containing protein [Amycolatopsis sp. lyj-346]|uniref:SAF domain-containing protein n=1 Tax=Amycolatopsis sp. lyj-346 TaxID=2789289 RepID=UPI00397BCD04
MPVLAIARPVSVGHLLERVDIREVEISAAEAVATLPAEQAASVLGRPMATSLTVGALLTPSSIGSSTIPAAGQSVVAVGLKAGQFPPELAPGAPVVVVLAASTPNTPLAAGQSSSDGPAWPATVTGLSKAEAEQTTVISLQMPSATAPALARVPAGQVTLVMVAGGER